MDNLESTADVLWRGKWFILAGLVCGLLGATLATKLSSKVYQATGVIQVQSALTAQGGEILGVQQASQGLAATYARLVTAPSFMARIRPQVAGGRYTAGELGASVNAAVISQNTQATNLIELSATAASPKAAEALANGVANAFVNTVDQDNAQRAAQQQAQLQQKISSLTHQIDTITGSASRLSTSQLEQVSSLRTARAALTTELAGAIASGAGQNGSVSIVAPATASSFPIKPRPTLNALVGAAVGLLIGIGLAWLRGVLDRELHGAGEIQSLVDVPVLASVPLRRGADRDDLVTREAYDILRTNLTFVALERPLSVLTVTSYEAGEGKTATVEGLAHAASRRDLKVLLIDGDLRTGALSERLGAGSSPGLTNMMVLARESDESPDMLVQVAPSLFLLPAGPAPPNPPSVLASSRMNHLVQALRDQFDLIVIDTPPIGHLADAAILSALSDGSLLVARAGRTRKADLVSAATALGRTPAPLVGVVVFEPRSLDSAYYPTTSAARSSARDAAAPPVGIIPRSATAAPPTKTRRSGRAP